jgi:hypothetical protein
MPLISLAKPTSKSPKKKDTRTDKTMTMAVAAIVSFREGQVTFLSSIFTSRKKSFIFPIHCTFSPQVERTPAGGFSFKRLFFGTSFSLVLVVREFVSSPGDFSGALDYPSAILFLFLSLTFFIPTMIPLKNRKLKKFGRPGGIRTPITRIWSPVL